MLSFFFSAFQDYLVTATAQEVLKYLAPNDSKYKMTARWLLKSANFSSIRNNITREGSIHTGRQNSIGRTFSQSLCCNCVQRAWNIITFLWGDPKTVTLWHLSLRIDLRYPLLLLLFLFVIQDRLDQSGESCCFSNQHLDIITNFIY